MEWRARKPKVSNDDEQAEKQWCWIKEKQMNEWWTEVTREPGCQSATDFVIGRQGVGGETHQNTKWPHQHHLAATSPIERIISNLMIILHLFNISYILHITGIP